MNKFIKDKKTIIFLVFTVAIIIRIIPFICTKIDVNCDEAMLALNARSIANTGKDIYGTSMPVYFEAWIVAGQSALPTYLSSICIKIFGYSIFSIRLPFFLLSIVSMYIAFKFSKKLFNEDVAIIILLLIAINPWHIIQAQIALDCNIFPHIVLISMYLLYIGLYEKKNKYLYLSMVFFALSMYCYGLSVFFVPAILCIIATYALLKKDVSIKSTLICVLIYMICIFPIGMMYVINYFKLESVNIFGITIQRFYYSTRNSDILFFSNNIISQLLVNIKTMLYIIFFQNDNLQWNQISGFGTIYLCSIPFVFIGIWFTVKNKNDRRYTSTILLWWIILAIVVGIITNYTNINRLNIVWYVLIMMCGYGIYNIVNSIKNKRFIKITIWVMYILLFSIFSYEFYIKFPANVNNSFTFSGGLVDACEYLNELEYDNVVLSTSVYKKDKQYVFIRYKLNCDAKDYIDRNQLLQYYISGEKYILCNYEKNIEDENFYTEINLEEDVYLVTQEDKQKILNLDAYENHDFNKYSVLIKKI